METYLLDFRINRENLKSMEENTTNSQEPEKGSYFKSEGASILFAIIAIGAVLAFIWAWAKGLMGKSPKIYKGKLIAKYNVDPKTFAKWMELIYFKGDVIKFKAYTQKKKISQYEADLIVNFFGERPKGTKILNKGKIIKLHGGCYKTLRNSVLKFANQIGITMEIYDALDTFPPKLTKKILEHYV